MPGHRRETCPQAPPAGENAYVDEIKTPHSTRPLSPSEVDDIIRMKVDDEMSPPQIAAKMGRSVPTVLRYLSKNGISHKVRRLRTTEPLTRSQWSDVQTSKKHGMTSGDIAAAMEQPLGEVNIAYVYTTYDHYVENR